jgi:SAM-dependent methyltransferase
MVSCSFPPRGLTAARAVTYTAAMSAAPATPAHIALGKPAGSGDLIIQRRYSLVRRLAPSSSGTLLDFGCGNGAQTLLFADDFPHVVGVDVDESSLRAFAETIRARALGDRVTAERYDGVTLPLPGASVDFAVSFEVLEHVRDERRALDELRRVLKPGARLAMSVPNRWWIFETHGAALPLLKWNRVPFFSWLPKRLHDRWARARIYSRGEIARTLREAGFDVEQAIYITAPMDVVRNPRLQALMRATLFRGDQTRVPFLSTAVLVIAVRRP